MIDLGPHALFIQLAWAAAGLVTLGLIAWVMIDYRSQRRQLAALEQAANARRRPAAPTPAVLEGAGVP
ncbi:heme exporter protein CcmD [Blastochloris sulfoviridis]|uniref:heme exporter protein CcmD n=1 Tax=Blastochloris sulfoviridis TaxID=50712 RepID=UPI001FE25160|nr:heme exporter protein CcmD [Blastochloris sulfoviridis]